jgi:hypothetical protein
MDTPIPGPFAADDHPLKGWFCIGAEGLRGVTPDGKRWRQHWRGWILRGDA